MALHDQRVNYETIKAWVLEAYFDFCRDRGVAMRMSHLEVLGCVDYNFEVSFERPIERLMFKVVELILTGSWHEAVEKNIRKDIDDIMAEYDLETLLAEIPRQEEDLFRRDLKVLQII